MSDTEETKIDSTNDTGASDSGADHAIDRHDHSDQERSASVRDAIKSAWAEQTGEEPEDSREERRKRAEKKSWEPKSRAAREAKEATGSDGKDATADANKQPGDAAAQSAGSGQQQADINTPPPAFSKEAKADWAKTPESVRRAAIKREDDVARGVASLQARYKEIDDAMAPHMNVVRAYGHTAGQAIAQFWGWFKALGEQPHIAFPALAKSYGWDPSIYYGQQQRAQQQQQQTQQAGGGQIDPQLYQYLQSVEHRLGAQQQMNEAHQMAQTQQVLADFAKDKPHFEKVRRRMGELLAPRPDGTSIIPLTPEGHVDLSTAYTMACNLDDTIREQMIAERIAQEKRAAKEAADKARRAGVSFAPTSPGKNTGSSSNAKQKRSTVRETIEAAIASSRDGGRI